MKRIAIIAAASLALLVISFEVGRHSAPLRTVTKTEVKTVTVERVVVQSREVEAKQATQEAQTKTVTVVKYRWLPGGAVEATSTTQAATETHAATTDHVAIAIDARRDTTATTEARTFVTVDNAKPQWSIAVMPGFDIGKPYVDLPVPRLVVGASVERRIVGPVFAGAWASTSGAAGLTVRIEL